MSNAITRLFKGLFKDVDYTEQPKGTYTFGLNIVNESKDGNLTDLVNENGNTIADFLPRDYIPLGEVYMSNDSIAVLSTSIIEHRSEIGILENGIYTTHVNFDLGFRLANQIDVTYRLRRGCERTIYWVDGDANKPRYYNFDKPENFQNADGNWDVDKFNLFKSPSTLPTFESIEIEELGNVPSGSYSFGLRLLDADLNPTEVTVVSDPIIIYHDNYSNNFSTIEGSTNLINDYQDFGPTNKSIKLTLDNLDEDFLFYQVAIIAFNSGNGLVSNVYFSDKIPVSVNTYTYTGTNAFTESTIEEVQAFTNIIDRANHILQLENRLILSETKGKQVNFCNLQKYASKIQADLITKEIVLNSVDVESNQKRGTTLFEGIGYMPGEIYSFGIVYIFKDGSRSPVYHIPGKNPAYPSLMSDDNTLQDTTYTSNSCEDTWGEDSEGQSLDGENVRHHRFPLRSEVGKPLFTTVPIGSTANLYSLVLNISGSIDPMYSGDTITYKVTYVVGGITYEYIGTINVASYNPSIGESVQITVQTSSISYTTTVEILSNGTTDPSPSGLVYSGVVSSELINIESTLYKSEIFGIKFSNIELPSSFEDIGAEQIIGYEIVRNDRTEDNKTILDSGVLGALGEEPYYVSHGILMPVAKDISRLKKDAFYLIHPEHKFNKKRYSNVTQIIQEGHYDKTEGVHYTQRYEDVMPGTSYDPEVSKRREKDADGFTLHTFTRNNSLIFGTVVPSDFANNTNLRDIFYLDALSSKNITDSEGSNKEVYNVSSDNNIGIIQLSQEKSDAVVQDMENRLPYVILKRELSNPYASFRVLPYYKDSHNIHLFDTTIEEVNLFAGDSYISPMRYTSTMYYDTRLRERSSKSGIWNIVLGVLAVVVGAAVGVVTLGAGLLIAGFGVSQIATGIKKEKIAKVYNEAYEDGLRDTVKDAFIENEFSPNPSDDEVQWYGEILTNLWFESSVNINWRKGNTIGLPDFLASPVNRSTTMVSESSYIGEKLTKIDSNSEGGRLYQGFANAELYEINPDYSRSKIEKLYYHLPLEYDCCSDCRESFPHRNHYSEQSFQEELTDNYRVFLPNNYRDIEGETGRITNTFKIQDNMYIHTEEALWHLPQSLQERVTDNIVTYIGTGEFFAIPPKKVVDDETGNSAGTNLKWSTIKTSHGVFFVSDSQSTVYQFNGNNLVPISNEGLYNWFKENTKSLFSEEYRRLNKRDYEFNNNPSNPIGVGFVAVYDSRFERIIFTKKDVELNQEIIGSEDFRLTMYNGSIIIFRDYLDQISEMEVNDYTFSGIIEDKMQFTKDGEILEIQGEVIEQLSDINSSYTISYSIKSKSWISYHSYLPSFYLSTPDKFYSWLQGDRGIWRHNIPYLYNNFYGIKKPVIIEYVSNSNPLQTRIWEYLTLICEAYKFDQSKKEFINQRLTMFNKIILYNSEQCSGELNIQVKDSDLGVNYLSDQIKNNVPSIIADRNERDWTINDLRDYRIDYDSPIFNSSKSELQTQYFIDKILNTSTLDFNKPWFEVQSFRDKYLVIRLIFDTFDDVKMVFKYSGENEENSIR